MLLSETHIVCYAGKSVVAEKPRVEPFCLKNNCMYCMWWFVAKRLYVSGYHLILKCHLHTEYGQIWTHAVLIVSSMYWEYDRRKNAALSNRARLDKEKTSPRRTLLFYSTVHVSSLDQCCRSSTKTMQRPLLFTKRPEYSTGTLWNDLRAPSDTQYTLTPFCVIREISYWFYNVKRTWRHMLDF